MESEHETHARTSHSKNYEHERSAYLDGRWKEQSTYFDEKAKACQSQFILLRRLSLIAGILTPIAIFVVTLLMGRHFFSDIQTDQSSSYWWYLLELVPIMLSVVAIGCYQWEELHNFGAQWSKFRLVAERLKSHREFFEHRAGIYEKDANGKPLSDEEALKKFITYCEGLIEGNDVNYFILMVDPLRREIA